MGTDSLDISFDRFLLVVTKYCCFLCVGYDVIAQAQSGTGKTATFAISILQQIDVELKATQAMVLAPTRELAQQVRYLTCSGLFTGFVLKAQFDDCFKE